MRIPRSLALLLTGVVILVAGCAGSAWYTGHHVRGNEKRYPPQGEFLTLREGTRLHYVRRGQGQTVVFIHGDGDSLAGFALSALDSVVSSLFQVIAVDRPGYGYSERTAGCASPVKQARLLHEAVVQLQVGKPILVGHSSGAAIALAYAIQYPEDVAAVVTLAGAAYGQPQPPLLFRALATPRLGSWLAHTVAVPLAAPLARRNVASVVAPDRTGSAPYADVNLAYELRPGQLLAHAEDMVRFREEMPELQARYAELQMPVVIVHGTADRNVPVAVARDLASVVPNARLVELEGLGHEFMFSHPEEVVRGVQFARLMSNPRTCKCN